MKADIHPKYYMNTKASCVCGAEYDVASNEPTIRLDICSNCHPFFTGNTKILDIAGRVERFEARRKATSKKGK